MKLLRVALACTVLLLIAVPSFAIPCSTCSEFEPQGCDSTPGSGTRCRFSIDWCQTISAPSCSGFSGQTESPVLADWVVASIEISRPAYDTKVVSSPAALAKAEQAETVPQK